MKTYYSFLMLVFMMIMNTGSSYAQEIPQTDTSQFKVSGVCGQCEVRIENAALIRGVKWAQWDKETQMLTVIYRSDKVSPDAIHLAVAQAGHDTEKVKAPDEVYNRLPRCCAYRDAVGIH